jgi:hypothetical protein
LYSGIDRASLPLPRAKMLSVCPGQSIDICASAFVFCFGRQIFSLPSFFNLFKSYLLIETLRGGRQAISHCRTLIEASGYPGPPKKQGFWYTNEFSGGVPSRWAGCLI